MTRWEPMKDADLHKGAIGYVSFSLRKQDVMILCEVIDIKEKTVEIVPIAGDKTCLWINSDEIYTRHGGLSG